MASTETGLTPAQDAAGERKLRQIDRLIESLAASLSGPGKEAGAVREWLILMIRVGAVDDSGVGSAARRRRLQRIDALIDGLAAEAFPAEPDRFRWELLNELQGGSIALR
jgi:hypothetical protein